MIPNTQIPPEKETFSVRILNNGIATLVADREGETFHPEHGPAIEARTLYVDQVRLDSLWESSTSDKPVCVWDVGLGAAANSTEIIRSLRRVGKGHLRMLSFDRTLAPLEAALASYRMNSAHFEYFSEMDWDKIFPAQGWKFSADGTSIDWTWHLDDFVQLIQKPDFIFPAPDLILYDCYSPTQNWSMWTLAHWKNILKRLSSARPSRIIFYSRSTALRVTLLLAGFFVGYGCATGAKEETTLASNALASLERPLPPEWLQRVRRSAASHPFTGDHFLRRPLSEEQWDELLKHPQFSSPNI